MIYVFKTSVNSELKLKSATVYLNDILSDAKWNFDLEDCDNILRIDSQNEIVEMLLSNNVFDCTELE
ncbi:hypothetical protein QWY99_03535 [Flavobacterium branchiarum]|uniref:Uncharacterized protein n=1 Tax=Flavobacterium branchiarum TaxID=1114870 RepID=A0ABV5FN98_9FLAO|nr:hypothetical protein [Flavobacterium branchiarum]MDN3672140.1 hypothetical protein [Flavobacterium branchiarum]